MEAHAAQGAALGVVDQPMCSVRLGHCVLVVLLEDRRQALVEAAVTHFLPNHDLVVVLGP